MIFAGKQQDYEQPLQQGQVYTVQGYGPTINGAIFPMAH